MCYFLYGAINVGLNVDDYNRAVKHSEYHFHSGNIKDVNACVENCDHRYRITFNHCDCDTAIGGTQTNVTGIKEFEELLLNLKAVRGIKYVLLSKNWWEETNTKQETVHIDDIDVPHFLANIEENCLYKIELYPKYF